MEKQYYAIYYNSLINRMENSVDPDLKKPDDLVQLFSKSRLRVIISTGQIVL